MLPSITMLALLVGLVACSISLLKIGRRPRSLPPGPPTLPIIGNLHLMPTRDAHLQFEAWARQYGPVYSLILGTKVVVVLSSHEAIRDLLDRRSAIYSDRIDAYIGSDVASNDMRMLTMKYGTRWRMIRKLFHAMLHVSIAKSYVPYQSLESKQMLYEILESPHNFLSSMQRYSNSLTAQMIFGRRTISNDDPKMKLLFESLDRYVNLLQAGTTALADFFPPLRFLPSTLLPTKKLAREIYKEQKELYGGLWHDVKDAVYAGTAKPCLSFDLAKLQEKEGFDDEQASYISGTALEAGSDTTSSTMYTFVQAMILFPEVQHKAQHQLEKVCGDRLPEVEDFENLPYIRCIMKETLRWLPTAVMGAVPHAVTQDDNYMGYLIPKGSGILNNVYTICNDPIRYPDPRRFEPERYKNDHNTLAETTTHSDPNVRDHFTFGAGRRVCQGMHVAERSLFLGMSRLLWAFDFRTVPGKVPDPARVTQGFSCMPQTYEADIKPREGRADLIRDIWEDAQSALDEEGQWK